MGGARDSLRATASSPRALNAESEVALTLRAQLARVDDEREAEQPQA
jgi:hypothetical protein